MITSRAFLGLALAGLLLSATAARAETPPSDPPAPTGDTSQQPAETTPPTETAAAEDSDSLDVIVCKTEPPLVGSRLGKRKVCKTRRQWRDEELGSDGRRLPQERSSPLEPGVGGGAR